MKRILAGLLAAPLVAAIGCETKSPPGGPGAVKTTTTRVTTETNRANNGAARTTRTETGTEVVRSAATFELKTPALETNLKPGEKKEIEIAISRGSEFNQAVALKFDSPNGLKVDPASAKLAPGQDSVKVHVEATDGAPVGHHEIKVTGTPDSGTATTVPIKIEVKKS